MDLFAIIFRWTVRLYLYSWYYFEKITRTNGFGSDQPVYIKKPCQSSGNQLKDALFQYHVKQFHESSCSVASVVSVVNALTHLQGTMKDMPVTQQELLERVKAAHWKERMGDNGYKGKRGLPLETLGQVVKASLTEFKISYKAMDIVPAIANTDTSSDFKNELKKSLERFEKKGDCLLISHFDQGSFIPEFHIPHISPVGGFDADTKTVTMLDVDPAQKWPYQISFDAFYKGISFNYHNVFRPFGFAHGGYIFIEL
ncbi:MAG: phytochelatin synthase [Desulfobacula sp.]|nr:phytochelatin synthase [Desulfobacula sp.]